MGAIRFTWWNLQNLFDTDDDPISKDYEYTAAHGWTQTLYKKKLKNLAAVLQATHNGQGPELLAVCEIEKDAILKDLTGRLNNSQLKVVEDPTGTSDLRGIDVAMAYDSGKLTPKKVTSHVVHLRYRTRDILEVVFTVTGANEELTVIACHWPSCRLGRYRSEPLRIAVAEHIAYLVESHVKVAPEDYEKLRSQNDLAVVQQQWEAKVLVAGDFNDEPGDRSVVDHLKASHDLDRVVGETNDIDSFADETAKYRGQDVFLYNPMWTFLPMAKTGTYFLDSLRSGEKFANRYQVLDQLVCSRGLVSGNGLSLDLSSVDVFRDPLVATKTNRPRSFNKSTGAGFSDHLPVTAVLTY